MRKLAKQLFFALPHLVSFTTAEKIDVQKVKVKVKVHTCLERVSYARRREAYTSPFVELCNSLEPQVSSWSLYLPPAELVPLVCDLDVQTSKMSTTAATEPVGKLWAVLKICNFTSEHFIVLLSNDQPYES